MLNYKLWQLGTGQIKRLMVEMPPRHGKSETGSKYFPAWLIGARRRRVILTSYEATFAASWGRKVRDILSEWGPALYGVGVSDSSAAMAWWELADGSASMMTAGVGGPITGKGGDLLIDDPVKNAEEANSQTYRDKVWDWYQSTAYTRLEPDGFVLLTMTRWHDDDLAGRLLKEQEHGGDQWEVIKLPAIAEHDECIPLADGYCYRRAEGEPLWPERFNTARLAEIRTAVGSQVWASLYQQRPTPDGGLIWHREWFKRYSELPPLTRIIQTIDTAFQTGVASDYSVIATWGRTETDYYLVDLWRARVEYPELKRAIIDQARKHEPEKIYLEKAASGQSAFQELRRETDLPIVAIPPQGSKESRAAAVSPLAEAGHVWIPAEAPWVADWVEEHVAFPRGAHDDQVDTTSLALSRLSRRSAWDM